MIRKATTGNYSARDLKLDFGLPVGVRIILQILSATPHLKYKTMRTAPMMTALHRQNRFKWGCRLISNGDFFEIKSSSTLRTSSTATDRIEMLVNGMNCATMKGFF